VRVAMPFWNRSSNVVIYFLHAHVSVDDQTNAL